MPPFIKSVPEKGFRSGSAVKNSPANAGDTGDKGLIPGLKGSPGGGHGNPLQHSCWEIPTVRGAWLAVVHHVAKKWIQLKRLNTAFLMIEGVYCI